MAPRVQTGENALYRYNKIRYTFVQIDAGKQKILTSDPWSYLNSFLQVKKSNARGPNKVQFERAIYFANLAENFFNCSSTIPLPAKSTLLYYGMLDLVKCFLSINGTQLEQMHEHHGLSLPIGQSHVIDVKSKKNKDAININSEFAKLLKKPVTKPLQVRFEQALSHIPEIHSIYTALGHIDKQKLLPVDINFLVNDKRDKLFTEISYAKENESTVDIDKFYKNSRKQYLREGINTNGVICFRAKRMKSFTQSNIHRIYRNILQDYEKLNIVPMLTKEGYRYYADLRPGELSSLSYTLIAMFYLGSAARYRPLEISDILEGPLRPLVSEFISLSPKQFLYQLVSLITEEECVIPFAAI